MTPGIPPTSSRTDISQCPQVMPVTSYSCAAIGSSFVGDTLGGYRVLEEPYTPEGYIWKASEPQKSGSAGSVTQRSRSDLHFSRSG
ncbi:hypothetical protein GCM10009626_22130 [Brachybacterium sacelli]